MGDVRTDLNKGPSEMLIATKLASGAQFVETGEVSQNVAASSTLATVQWRHGCVCVWSSLGNAEQWFHPIRAKGRLWKRTYDILHRQLELRALLSVSMQTFWSENMERRVYKGDLAADGRLFKMGVKESEYKGTDWIHLACSRVRGTR
jgi:hypothetical protein